MITFKEYFMLQEAPVGPEATRRAKRTSTAMMEPGDQGRPVGGGGGEQPNAIPEPAPLPRLRNNAAVRQGAAGHAGAARRAANTQGAVNTAMPGAFGTEFDREVTTIDPSDVEGMQALLLRMNKAIADNQGKLDKENALAGKGLKAPDQTKLADAGKQLGLQRNYHLSQQINPR